MGRGKRDRVAELFESANMMTLQCERYRACQSSKPEIRVRFLLPQDMVNDHQQTVGDGDNGLLSPSSSRNAMVLGRQIIVLIKSGPTVSYRYKAGERDMDWYTA